jgi:transcriptional regulator with GAF, ATPase, and Fis domain
VIRAAEGGTLFLDEIGDLPLETQPKLLRFLDSKEIHPLGEATPQRVAVRIVAATNADLDRNLSSRTAT